MLEYYGFEVPNPSETARQYFRKLARSTLRLFIYAALGLDPSGLVPAGWREFHDRLILHSEPTGHFSVLKETANIVITAIKAGLRVDSHTVPDISVGKTWGKQWSDNTTLEIRFGKRIKHPHNYPDYMPQAASNPQDIWCYPVDALGEFRRWMESEYLPSRFPKYLDGKVKDGLMPAKNAAKLLAEINGDDPKMLKYAARTLCPTPSLAMRKGFFLLLARAPPGALARAARASRCLLPRARRTAARTGIRVTVVLAVPRGSAAN